MEINIRKQTSLLLSILLLNILFFRPFTPLGFILIILNLLTFISFSSYNSRKKGLIIASFLILFCMLFIFITRAYWFVIIIASFFSFYILIIHLYLVHTQYSFFSSAFDFLTSPFRVGIKYIRSAGYTIQTIWSIFTHINTHPQLEKTHKYSLLRSVIFGLFIGLPIATVLLIFLSDADPIYAHFIRSLFNENILHEIPIRILFSLWMGLLLFPFLLFKPFSRSNYSVNNIIRFQFINEMIIISSLIAVIMASFLVIQWQYVFVHVPFETDLSSYGIATYSEYVRKGFLELIKVSFFVYGLLWIGLIALRGKETYAKKILLFLQSVIMAEFLIFTLSVFRRIWLYQLYHGWSLIRIYGGLLVFWLAGITLILAFRHFTKKNWVMFEIVWSIILILFIGFFNAEGFIVKHHPPTVNKRIDYVYLSRMSPDGCAGWKMSYEHSKKVLSKNKADNDLVINEDARREIAYSGIVLSKLNQQYVSLLKEYGTAGEIRAYALEVIEHQIQSIEKFKPHINDSSQRESYNREVRHLNELKSRMQKKESEYIIAAINAKNTYYPIFNKPNYPGDLSFFYFDDNIELPKKRMYAYTGLNRLLLTNLSNMKAFNMMKQEIPYKELLQLQKQYFDLSLRIASQPAGQTEYQKDISTDSPLL